MGHEGPVQIITDNGPYPLKKLVIAAGAYSRRLTRELGVDLPLETERGYHAELPNAGIELPCPLLFSEYGFGATVMNGGLRLAGTVEFAGLDAVPNYGRADVLVKRAKQVFGELDSAGAKHWMGRRPSFPDSLPVISASPRHANVFFAFGHGHLGLTLAALSGRLIADLVAGRDSGFDLTPYGADRF